MGIINTNPNSLPLADKQALIKVQMTEQINSLFSLLNSRILSMFHSVWENQLGLTPQEVFDSFGKDAGSLHALFGIFSTALNQAQPGSIVVSEPKTVVINQDGTVTVAQ